MKAFLEYVADDLIAKFGTDLSRVAVVFPNKRASLFLSNYLAQRAKRPLWSPSYITISELFRRQSRLTVPDNIKLICDLYQSFVTVTGIDETLDHFYGWGQLLLTDFDDIDKNMADADKLFANVRDLHELDDVSYLSEQQKAIISKFFSNFADDHNSRLKERFLKLWSRMADIYHDYNKRLSAQGMAYEGALYRQVSQQEMPADDYDLFVFVGFNLLQKVEQQLFDSLKKQGRARFYWDFDNYYMKGHEAGHYISQYLAHFPNELDAHNADIYDRFAQKKEISFISASTENMQARYLNTWLADYNRIEHGTQTAIVMCNEALLPTVISSLPEGDYKLNITTGYPLSQSPAASFITSLMTLQTQGFDDGRQRWRLHYVNGILQHPYLPLLSDEGEQLQNRLIQQRIYYPAPSVLAVDEGTTLLFGHPTGSNEELLAWLCDVVSQLASRHPADDQFFQESVFRTYTLLNRLHSLVNSGDLNVDVITLQRLLVQIIQTTSIPFHGEPAEGIQVMGVLETRNLDFRHLVLLSCNEGNMPKGVNDTSFIPYSIRKAYGLTTIDHKVAIYSYYFHRLLQRAEDITVLYCNATTDGQTGEKSRFMLQLMVESGHKIGFSTLQSRLDFKVSTPQPVEKTADVMRRLMERFELKGTPTQPLLTPTAVNRYMRCPLIFYYNYVCGLREPEVNDDDKIDNRIFGNIFHEASRLLYNQIKGQDGTISGIKIANLLKSKIEIEQAVDQAFRTELFNVRDPHTPFKMELNGLQIINREVIIHYLRQLLTIDRRLSPFTMLGLESDVMQTLKTQHITTTIGGRIDRLDLVGNDGNRTIRVIDYKTGSQVLRPLPDLEAIFREDSLAQHSDYYLQTLLYSHIVMHSDVLNPSHLPVSPALLFIQHTGAEDYSPILKFGRDPINDIATHDALFMQILKEKIDEIFAPATVFAPTDDRNRCRNCPYRKLCM